jgi:hypothetical protein
MSVLHKAVVVLRQIWNQIDIIGGTDDPLFDGLRLWNRSLTYEGAGGKAPCRPACGTLSKDRVTTDMFF